MPLFVTIGYGDQEVYERTDPAVRAAAHAHDEHLTASGVTAGMAGPPVQVRNPDATGTTVEPGPFLSAPFPVAGFALVEAGSLDEAVALVAQTPCAVVHGVVEVWPLVQGG